VYLGCQDRDARIVGRIETNVANVAAATSNRAMSDRWTPRRTVGLRSTEGAITINTTTTSNNNAIASLGLSTFSIPAEPNCPPQGRPICSTKITLPSAMSRRFEFSTGSRPYWGRTSTNTFLNRVRLQMSENLLTNPASSNSRKENSPSEAL
jgi:hypothetical protein